MRSNRSPAVSSWANAAKTSCTRTCSVSGGKPASWKFWRSVSAWREDFSTHTAEVAPRLRHSRLSAPVPANSSSTLAPTTRPPRLLNTACLTRSGVGRTARPFGTFRIRRAAFPPVIRMGNSNRRFHRWHEGKCPFGRTLALPRQASLEDLREELLHCFPGAAVGVFIVSGALAWIVPHFLLGEAMDGAAILDQLPVNLSLAHLVLKGGQVFGRHEGVIRALQRQHLALDVPAVLGMR